MKRILAYINAAVLAVMLVGCNGDDEYSSSPLNLLTFSTDTIKLDTVFSNVPTVMRNFWVYNNTGSGIRCSSISLESGASSGFRVNVNGVYLGESTGYSTTDVGIPEGDSIRVFVELTSKTQNQDTPQLVEDNLVFLLESGVREVVNLNAYSWDALKMSNVHITTDSTISSPGKPLIIYGGITVDSAAVLTIGAGTTLYFHNDAGIDVYGSLHTEGTSEANVSLRGDRIDHMFDYLPYDRLSGQWQGIHLMSSSTDNRLTYTDIHSPFSGIVIDSSSVDQRKLLMEQSTLHNCQGSGILAHNAWTEIFNSQISNTLGDCLMIDGGRCYINGSTIAQFYPFDSSRGSALSFSSVSSPLDSLLCRNSIITGYADDEMMGTMGDSSNVFKYRFENTLIRTPKPETADSLNFIGVVFENYEDTVSGGRKNFVKLDAVNFIYDFSPDSVSKAIGLADENTLLPVDRIGESRSGHNDAGAFIYIRREEQQ